MLLLLSEGAQATLHVSLAAMAKEEGRHTSKTDRQYFECRHALLYGLLSRRKARDTQAHFRLNSGTLLVAAGLAICVQFPGCL